MVDTFSTDAEMRGLADIRHDLLPISSQPPYSLLLGGCDEIGNKSPLAVRAACSQSLLLAMSWHSSVSDVLSPCPPRPSPRSARRGRIILWDDSPRAALRLPWAIIFRSDGALT